MTEILYYLWEAVEVVEDHGDGWMSCRWKSDGKTYKHWRAQLRTESLRALVS